MEGYRLLLRMCLSQQGRKKIANERKNKHFVSSVSTGLGVAIHLESDHVCGSLSTQAAVAWAGESREAPGAWVWGVSVWLPSLVSF